MLIAEQFLLLCLDEQRGTRTLSGDKIDPALGGALLIELALMERIGVAAEGEGWRQRGRVSVLSRRPTGNVELDRALQAVVAQEGRRAKDLISSMRSRRITKGLRQRLLQQLTAASVVVQQQRPVLGFIPRTVWPTTDPRPGQEVRNRLSAALLDGTTPTDQTVGLISLLYATGHLRRVVATDDKLALKARAERLTDGDWAAKAVRLAISETYSATAGAS